MEPPVDKARNRQARKKRARRENLQLLSMVSQLGISMLVPIAMCFFVGRLLDRRFGTSWIAIVLFFIGALAGFRSIYQLVKKYTKNVEE